MTQRGKEIYFGIASTHDEVQKYEDGTEPGRENKMVRRHYHVPIEHIREKRTIVQRGSRKNPPPFLHLAYLPFR
jgi:hypothetical protein